MFWDKGYTPSQNIELLLERENATVEEFLDDDDILQECKSQKKPIINYFTRPDVIKRLVEFITTEPSPELPMAQRFRHANMACEILTLGLPSLDEKLLSDADTLRALYSYLENEPPLNPLLSSFFSKTFSMLFTKKAEQDWFLYQKMCLQLLEYIKSQNNFLDLICKHFSTPIIPDLVMQMIRDVEGGQLKRNLYEWLTEDKLVERLIAILGDSSECEKHGNVAEFLCDLIQQGRAMRQTEQENDSFEPAFEGSNPILATIECDATVEALLNVILEPNALESAIVSGISVVLTLIKPAVFVDEPNSDRLRFIQNREKEIHEQIITTVIRVVAPRLKDFHEILRAPPNKPGVMTTAGEISPPFGMTRLQICRMFTVLLQTRNEEVTKAICETDFFDTLLALFKQYPWNNFLHSEVEKCLQMIFYTQLSNNTNSTQGSTIINDGSFSRNSNNGENSCSSFFDLVVAYSGNANSGNGNDIDTGNCNDNKPGDAGESSSNGNGDGRSTDNTGGVCEMIVEEAAAAPPTATSVEQAETEITDIAGGIGVNENNEMKENADDVCVDDTEVANQDASDAKEIKAKEVIADKLPKEDGEGDADNTKSVEDTSDEKKDDSVPETALATDESQLEHDTTKAPADSGPSALQTHVIVNCKLMSKLIECWQLNQEAEAATKRRRLGYMGHLIKIFKHITNCISESEHIGALIESSLSEATKLELWQSITDPKDGDFTMALATQSKMLANCNAQEACDYSHHLPKDFLTDNSAWDFIMSSNMIGNLETFNESMDMVFALENDMYPENEDTNADNDIQVVQYRRNIQDDEEDDEDVNPIGHKRSVMFGKVTRDTERPLPSYTVITHHPWNDFDPFSEIGANRNTTPWSADFGSDNFADFDAHFNAFASDMGESLSNAAHEGNGSSSSSDSSNGMNELNGRGSGGGGGGGSGGGGGRSSSGGGAEGDDEQDDDEDGLNVAQSISRMNILADYDDNANLEQKPEEPHQEPQQEEQQEQQKEQQQPQQQQQKQHSSSSSSSADDFSNSEANDNVEDEVVVVASSLVRTLNSVMQDSDDDDDEYEDDEGMWTKPLGSSNVSSSTTAVGDDAKTSKSSDEQQRTENENVNKNEALMQAANEGDINARTSAQATMVLANGTDYEQQQSAVNVDNNIKDLVNSIESISNSADGGNEDEQKTRITSITATVATSQDHCNDDDDDVDDDGVEQEVFTGTVTTTTPSMMTQKLKSADASIGAPTMAADTKLTNATANTIEIASKTS